MCMGRMHHVKVFEFKLRCKTANKFSFFLHLTVKWQTKRDIIDEMNNQNWSEWCHTCHSKRNQCRWQIGLNNDRHGACVPVTHCITLRTDLGHMVELFGQAHGTWWISTRRSWTLHGHQVELYLPKPSEMIYIPSIVFRKRGNVIGPRHFLLRYRIFQLLRNSVATKLLDANDNTD